MDTKISTTATAPQGNVFDKIRQADSKGNDCWDARTLCHVLGYAEFRNFEPVIKKAMLACMNSGQKMENHFVQTNVMVDIGSGAKRESRSFLLSRYACYLIIQNADPGKDIIARGQTYFAVQTRKQEVADLEKENQLRIELRGQIKVHNSRLSGTAKKAGVFTGIEFAIFQDHGYQGLYGGLTNKDIHKKRGLKKSQQILDHMGSTELAANFFRVTQTADKIQRENIVGKEKANQAHYDVGLKVRNTIHDLGGTAPENLPKAEDIKKIEKKSRKSIDQK